MCLFGKVLRNEVDEEFRFVQQALKDTVSVLLKQLVRERYPLKGETELKHMIDEIVLEKVHLESAYWQKIIERMYEQKDAEALESTLKSCQPRPASVPPSLSLQSLLNSARQTQRRPTREELQQHQPSMINQLYFGAFLKTLQDF